MAAFQSTLTDFSSAYRPATGLYFGAPIWQLTATGSGSSSSVFIAFVTKAKQGNRFGVLVLPLQLVSALWVEPQLDQPLAYTLL